MTQLDESGEPGEPGLWQRLQRWWQGRRPDPRAGEGGDSAGWIEEQDDAADPGGGDGGNGGGDGGD